MAIHFSTKAPNQLLSDFKKAIDEGHVKTWSYDNDGDFTHTADQWVRRAWLTPFVVDGEELVLYILNPNDTQIDKVVYAVYHGRFIESMLSHLDKSFTAAVASAMPENGDKVG